MPGVRSTRRRVRDARHSEEAMYAIIRAGGKQAKVREGDVIDVERIKADDDEITFRPLLLVGDDGSVISDREALDAATVTATILGENRGEKVDVFKYKNKTGYRRRSGHRQTYSRIQVTKIEVPGADRKTAKAAKAADETAAPATADSGDAAQEE
jgi:large subunit ribosomal protein L21